MKNIMGRAEQIVRLHWVKQLLNGANECFARCLRHHARAAKIAAEMLS